MKASLYIWLARNSSVWSSNTSLVALNMSLLKRRTTPVDHSNFLWALRRKLSSNRQFPFQLSIQQDVPDILQVVLDELKGYSTIASNILTSSVRTSIICDMWLLQH